MPLQRITRRLGWTGFTCAGLVLPLHAQTISRILPERARIELRVGDRDTVRFQFQDRRGQPVPDDKVKRTFDSSDTTVVLVSPVSGFLVAMSAGTARLRVSAGGRFGYSLVTVTALPPPPPPPRGRLVIAEDRMRLVPGETAAVRAWVVDETGNRALDSHLAFSVTAEGVASVDALTGHVSGLQPGVTAVQISAPGMEPRTVLVEVTADSVALSADSVYLLLGFPDTLRLTVPGQGNRAYGGPVDWEAGNPNVVRVDAGVLTPVTPGATTVTVRNGSFVRSVPVSVLPVAMARSTPPTDSVLQLPIGSTAEFAIRGVSVDGVLLYRVPAAWALSDTTIARFDPATGVLTALAVGRVTLSARPLLRGMDRARTWPVEILGGRLIPQAARLGLRVGMKGTVAAVLQDSTGATIGRPIPVAWQDLQSPQVETTSGGELRARGVGRARVTGWVRWGDSVRIEVLGVPDMLVSASTRGRTRILGLSADRSVPPVELQQSGSADFEASVSPDRTRMVFTSTRSGRPQVWVADADGANPMPLLPGPVRAENPVWSPDGRWIAMTYYGDGTARVVGVRPDGTGLRAISDTGAPALAPSFSTDGRSILFESVRGGQYDVISVRVDSALQRVGLAPEVVLASPDDERAPRYFPNGDICFIRQERRGARSRGLVRRVAGTSLFEVLTPPDLYVTDYAIAPDGFSILVSATPAGKKASSQPSQLYLLDLRTAGSRMPVPFFRVPDGSVGAPSFVP